jgi:hypothetical protein
MDLAISAGASPALPIRRVSPPASIAWPMCGRVVDVSGGPNGRAVRCHLSHGHRGECDDLGSSELEHWRVNTAPAPAPAPAATPVATPAQVATPNSVKTLALAQARTYEAVGQWRLERGADAEAGQLFAMAEALRKFVLTLDR